MEFKTENKREVREDTTYSSIVTICKSPAAHACDVSSPSSHKNSDALVKPEFQFQLSKRAAFRIHTGITSGG
jgi:hypothetical protein